MQETLASASKPVTKHFSAEECFPWIIKHVQESETGYRGWLTAIFVTRKPGQCDHLHEVDPESGGVMDWGPAPTPVDPPTFPRLLLVFLIVLVMQATCYGCNVEHCSRQYGQYVPDQEMHDPSGAEYCGVLREYASCIRTVSRQCKGDLKYHGVLGIVTQLMKKNNCSLHPLKEQVPSKPSPSPPKSCMFRGRREYRHCGLFGDPHLKTFHNQYQTCRVNGAWPLIDNPYLAVQVTNEPVVKYSPATATTKVTVIVKGGSTKCTSEKTYEAQSDYLPPAFIDGTQSSGPEQSVKLVVQEQGARVEIRVRYIDTVIVIRRVGGYLAFAMRMPVELVEQSEQRDELQLCVLGCPTKEQLNSNKISESVIPWESALTKCRSWNVTDNYLDWCFFDLMTTGDPSFSEAARSAQADMLELDPESASKLPNRTDLLPEVGQVDEQVTGGSSRKSLQRTLSCMLILMMRFFVV